MFTDPIFSEGFRNIDGKKNIKSYELLKKHAKKFAWNIFKAKRFDDAKNVKSRHGYLSGPLCTEFFKFCPKIKRHFCLLLIGSPHFLNIRRILVPGYVLMAQLVWKSPTYKLEIA